VIAPWVESAIALEANWCGNYGAAIERFEPLVGELRSSNQLFAYAQVSSHHAIALAGAGRYVESLTALDEGIRVTESIGDQFWRARMWNTRGWVLTELGAFEEADESNQRCLEIARQVGSLRMTPELVGNAACNLADAAMARGELSAAEAYLAEVGVILADGRNEWMTWRYGMHYRAAAAEHALATGHLARARELGEACLAAAQRSKSRRYIVRSQRLLARCAAVDGDAKGAVKALGAVAVEARRLGNPPQLWSTLGAEASVLATLGRKDDARNAASEGLASLDAVAGKLPDALRSALRLAPIRTTLGDAAT